MEHDHAGADHGHGHSHGIPSTPAARGWLLAAFVVILAFMVGEVIAAFAAHSLALLADAGHMLTDAGALLLAFFAAGIAERPPKGQYTYGFARIDAVSGQVNGITLLLLAGLFIAESVHRLAAPGPVHGGVVTTVAVIGVVINGIATWLAGHADRHSLNVKGVLAHLVTDIWAFAATIVAGVVVTLTGWARADALATLAVALFMAWSGATLVRAAIRILLEGAPRWFDTDSLGRQLAALDGVVEVHDLHVWQLRRHELAMSAHVLVTGEVNCHQVCATMRDVLHDEHGIEHATVQVDHADALSETDEHCVASHGLRHVADRTTASPHNS